VISYIWAKFFKKIKGSAIRNSKIDKTSKVEAGSHIVNTKFERHSFCGYDCEIYNCDIGAFTSIANNVVIGGSSHPMGWVSMSPVFYDGRDSVRKKYATFQRESDKKTKIGNDVWIGERAIIKQGITIGDGAVIGMGSIVTKDVPAYSIWAGNPAKFIRKRFSDAIICDLMEIKWWNFEDKKMNEFAKYFNDVSSFLEEIKK
jgi:Acetyltransferase (isoleucine patch superfamily)